MAGLKEASIYIHVFVCRVKELESCVSTHRVSGLHRLWITAQDLFDPFRAPGQPVFFHSFTIALSHFLPLWLSSFSLDSSWPTFYWSTIRNNSHCTIPILCELQSVVHSSRTLLFSCFLFFYCTGDLFLSDFKSVPAIFSCDIISSVRF